MLVIAVDSLFLTTSARTKSFAYWKQALNLHDEPQGWWWALERTQPGLPMKKGRCGTMTHDYKRNGTATLFAALDAFQGHVISMYDEQRRYQEWLKFLRAIDDVVPAGKQIHMIVDNYSTHKHEEVKRRHSCHPRFHVQLHTHQLLLVEHGGAVFS